MKPDEEAARTFNRRTAERYDAEPYAPQPEPMLDLERTLGLACLYGCGPEAAPDVLDLGCSVGVQLERLATQTAGRIVGVDISSTACAEAERRLAGRGEVIAADLMDLDPDRLGRFDLIYCVGLLYVTPEPVRRRSLEFVARCLKPGGAALFSYYAGGLGLMRAELNRMIRTVAGDDLTKARGFLNEVASQFQRGDQGLPSQTAQLTAAYTDDPTLRHEILCEAMTALHTSDLQAALKGEGLAFLGYLGGWPYGGVPADRRGVAADLFDFMWGGYRYALFGKGEGEPDAARVPAWRSALRRQAGGVYRDPVTGASLKVAAPAVQAALERMAAGPVERAQLEDGGRALDDELTRLALGNWITPLWR
jgi:SAM-dependent methyltransferase